jgi:hypothetical protein
VTIGRLDVSGCLLAALAVGFLAAAPVGVAGEGAFFQGKQVRFYTWAVRVAATTPICAR